MKMIVTVQLNKWKALARQAEKINQKKRTEKTQKTS